MLAQCGRAASVVVCAQEGKKCDRVSTDPMIATIEHYSLQEHICQTQNAFIVH